MSEEDDPNPYAPPVVSETSAPKRLFGQRDGLLAVRDGAELPHVCVISNVVVEAEEKRETKRLSSAPSWYENFPSVAFFIPLLFFQNTRDFWKHIPIDPWMVMIFVIFLPSAILQFIWKRADVTFSLAEVWQRRFTRLRILGHVFTLLVFCALMFGIRSQIPWFIPSLAMISLIAGFVISAKSHPMSVVKYRDGWFLINGASPDFVASLPPV